MMLMPMDELEHRRLYRIRSRNLVVGVWNASARGFVGVRNKFGSEYPFVEYHYDADKNYGTVDLMEPMDRILPDWIDIRAGWSICEQCDDTYIHWVRFPNPHPDGPYGEYIHDGEADHKPFDVRNVDNKELLNWLKPFDKAEIEVRDGKQEEVDVP